MKMEKSMDEKLSTLYRLSMDLAYTDNNACEVVDTDEKYGKEISDIIWGMVDGLYPAWIIKRIEGRCSLQAMIDFDMTKTEKDIDNRIELLKEVADDATSNL